MVPGSASASRLLPTLGYSVGWNCVRWAHRRGSGLGSVQCCVVDAVMSSVSWVRAAVESRADGCFTATPVTVTPRPTGAGVVYERNEVQA